MVDLPELGIGVVYTPSLETLLEAGQELIQAIEIEPQPFWLKTQSPKNPYRLDKKISDRINQYRQPKIIHSVGLPIGGTLPLDENYIKCLVESIEVIKPVWVSEHLTNLKAIFWEISENYLQTEYFSIDVLLEQIRQMQQLWNLRSLDRVSHIDLKSMSKLNKIAQRRRDAEESKEEVIFALPSISQWEETLGCLAADRSSNLEFVKTLDRDRGIEVLQYLVSSMRGGTAVDALKLSSRLLMLSLGKPNFRKLLKEFWKTTPKMEFCRIRVSIFRNDLYNLR